MKLSVVLAGSILGMVGTSVGVAWVTTPTSAAAAAPSPKSWDGGAADEPAGAPAEVAAPAEPAGPDPTFLAQSGALRVEGRLGHTALPSASGQETWLLVDVSAPEATDVESRAPVNVSIVLDRSGSMKGQRMTNALAAVRGMMSQLRDDDLVSIVAYDDDAELLLSPTPIRRVDAFSLGLALDRVQGRGHTCVSCGIEMGRAMLRRSEGAVQRLLLLSDGEANRGVVEPGLLSRLGDAARREGMSIATIGVDVDYDERTMLALSEASNGRHYFVDRPGELARVFEEERRSLVGSVADRVDVDVRLAEGVRLLEVVDRPHRQDGDVVQLSLGRVAAGEQKTVLMRVRIDAPQGARPIADVRLSYRDLVADREASESGELGLVLDPELLRADDLDAAVEARLGRKETFDALIAANAAFARGDVAGAERELDGARKRIASRQTRAKPKASAKLDADFEKQLQVLGGASSGFAEAARDVAPTAAPARREGKASVRANAAVADPFSD